MHTRSDSRSSRRRFLKLSGAGLALIPLVNLTGCSDGEERAAPPPPASEAPPARPEARTEPQTAMPAEETQTARTAPEQQWERLDENSPNARALGYVHDAAPVDASAQPRFQPGQVCGNCNLYQPDAGDAGEEWGGCSIFPGKLVNVNGWCSAYVPMAT